MTCIRLFRAVSAQELLDIFTWGGFRPTPSSLQGKWFAEKVAHAAEWGRRLFHLCGPPFHIVLVDVPAALANQMFQLTYLDHIGPARYAETSGRPGRIGTFLLGSESQYHRRILVPWYRRRTVAGNNQHYQCAPSSVCSVCNFI